MRMFTILGQDDLLMTEAFRTANGFETPTSATFAAPPQLLGALLLKALI
jgi:hypothetical protein